MKSDNMGGGPDMTNRRERKKQETRNKIFNTAMTLFQDRGYDATTIDMIAEQADVARGTVFLHFPSKEAILSHWGDDLIEEIENRREEWDLPDRNCKQKIYELFRLSIDESRESFPLVKVWVKSTLATPSALLRSQSALRQLLAELLEEGQEVGRLKQTIDPIIAANMLENIYLHALYDWVLSEGDWPIEEILATKIEYLFGGLAE
jgi:AcrR family transcriptional regulator